MAFCRLPGGGALEEGISDGEQRPVTNAQVAQSRGGKERQMVLRGWWEVKNYLLKQVRGSRPQSSPDRMLLPLTLYEIVEKSSKRGCQRQHQHENRE